MLRYFGLSILGDIALLTEVGKIRGRASLEWRQIQEFSFSHVKFAMPLRYLTGHVSGVPEKV